MLNGIYNLNNLNLNIFVAEKVFHKAGHKRRDFSKSEWSSRYERFFFLIGTSVPVRNIFPVR